MKQPIDFSTINVRSNIDEYMASEDGGDKGRQPDDRFASFDYCFNYCQSFRNGDCIGDICHPENIQQSCLQLGFYLASWGMLRGSSFLLDKSVRFYKSLLQTIIEFDTRLWEVDVDSYTEENVGLLLDAAGAIRKAMSTERWPSDTLVTKIMLGVFGNIPAFDTFFCDGLGVGTLNSNNLKRVAEFYDCHKTVIDKAAASIHTLDFHTGKDTDRHYTKAKIVDMIGFMEGQA